MRATALMQMVMGTWTPQPTWLPSESEPGVIRPGIVHRLDKGTTGLLVAAKDARTLAALAEQFKAHTVRPSCVGPCSQCQAGSGFSRFDALKQGAG